MPTLGGYVSEEVYDKYDALAKKMGITKSKLVGQAITTSKIVNNKEIENLELQTLRAIQRCGANLNQVAKYCNTYKGIDVSVLQKLVEIEKKLNVR